MAPLLRHDKKYHFDEYGWRAISDLVAEHGFSQEELVDIVANDPKGRFEFSNEKPLIRAKWGHSFPVNYGNECKDVPDTLYHGTADIYLPSIQREGLKEKDGRIVHLTNDRLLAIKIGKRHGTPIVLSIDAKRMKEDGLKFWRPGEYIWLTKEIEIQYISFKR